MKVLNLLVQKCLQRIAVVQYDSLLFVPSHVPNSVTVENLKCSKSLSADKIPRVSEQKGRG